MKIRNGWYWIFNVLMIGSSVLAILVVLVILALWLRRPDYTDMGFMVSKLDMEQATHQHNTALNTAARRFQENPVMSMNRKEYEYYVNLALLTRSRIFSLKGLSHGPKSRKKWRGEIVEEIKKRAREQEPA